MNDLQIFKSPEFGEIRASVIDGEPWFVAADVCKVLDHSNVTVAVDRLDADEKAKFNLGLTGGETNCVNEYGLYSLVLGSRKPDAKAFKRWITHDVIPSIRKHGAYMTPDTIDKMIASPEFGIKLLTALQEERQKVNALQAENSALTVKTAIMAPKAEYFDALVDRESLLSIRETAKALGIGERQLVAELLARKYLYRDRKGKLLPYAEKNRDYFEVKECTNDKTGWCGAQTMVTVRGREMIMRWNLN